MVKRKQVKKVSKTTKKQKVNYNLIQKILPFVLILVVMSVAFYVRSGPITLNSMDEKIEASVYNNVKNVIASQIGQQYPNLDDFSKQELIQKEYDKVLETGQYQGYVIDDVVAQSVEGAKAAFKADNNQTYLNAIDPYHFLKYNDLYDENGYIGTELVDGEPYLDYKLAPVGQNGKTDIEFHTFVETLAYKLAGTDYQSTDGEKTSAIYLIPVIFVILTVIPIYLITRKYTNDLAAMFASLVLVTIGTYVSRTIAGFVDTDAYNVFFPLLILAFLVYAIFESKLWLKLTYIALAGLAQGLFLWAWGPGWFMFLFAATAFIGYVLYLIIADFIEDKKISKEIINRSLNLTYGLVTFVISSFVFVFLFTKNNLFKTVYTGLLGSVSGIASISQTNVWPNVLSSVAELNPASFAQIISSVGGKFVFLIAMLGLVLITLNFKKEDLQEKLSRALILISFFWYLAIVQFNTFVSFTANFKFLFLILLFLPVGLAILLSLINKNKSQNLFITMILSIWIAGTIYMSLNGVRFILLLAPAFAIAFGIGLYYIAKIVNNFIKEEFRPKSIVGQNITGMAIITIIFAIIFTPMFTQAVYISENTLPNFDDAWYSSMYKIKNNSNEDAIITSWWDFGHFFAAIADRGVTFDGGTQGTPRAHWVGKLLMENNEEVSHDILKMLVCSGNEAFNTFYEYVGQDNADAVKINKVLYQTFGVEDKKTVLQNNKYYDLTEEQIDNILSKLDCEEPVEDFLITSEDMVGKAGVWAHWGSWDFTKKYTYDNYKKLSAEEIAINIDENTTLIAQYVAELEQIEVTALEQDIKKENLVNQWFADYPSYIPLQNNYLYPCQNNDDVSVICQNGIEVSVQTGQIITNPFEGNLEFRNLYIPGVNNTLNVVEQNVTGTIDAVFVPSSTGLNILLAQAPLGGSLYTKLFYLDGMGTQYFDKFDDFQSASGVRVKVWEVNLDLDDLNIELMDNLTVEEVPELIE